MNSMQHTSRLHNNLRAGPTDSTQAELQPQVLLPDTPTQARNRDKQALHLHTSNSPHTPGCM